MTDKQSCLIKIQFCANIITSLLVRAAVNLVTKILNLLQKRYFLITTLALVVFYLPFLGYQFFQKKAVPSPVENTKIVEIEELQNSDIRQTVRLIGTIRPKHATILIAKGSGMLDSLVATGNKIQKGELIAKIDNPDIENNLQLAEVAEKIAKTQFERLQSLLKSGIVSSKEAEEKKQAWIISQKELSKAKIELDTMRFYAPFDGIIGAYKKREGTQVNQGDPIVTIYDPSALVVDFDIPCTNLNTIKEGQSVRVFDKEYVLNHMQKMIDEETHMCPADVDISCENCVVGSNVDVDLVIEERKQVIVVPFAAIFLRNSKPFVYVVDKEKIVLVPVETGLKEKAQIEILSGLKPGQKLIIKGQERLYPGMQVAIYKPETATSTSS
ncbi:efflux RND transporter periplasmic adaptor subunit [Legionella massiliensis]|uniref:efflux RND transporter periplasmic adaptor subunit n=1 Tax=Legionella massiliensis TaxID=1034943 RepID=UPI000B037914|nr:efflux RND transporter periplasmic adaptor subunit [Legionella massiliensis]